MLRILITVVLAAHGLWHALGPATAGKLSMALWVGALVVLLAGTYGLATRQEWYRAILPVGAAMSILAVWPWTNTVPENQWFHILGIDVLILVALIFRWQFRFPGN